MKQEEVASKNYCLIKQYYFINLNFRKKDFITIIKKIMIVLKNTIIDVNFIIKLMVINEIAINCC